MLSIHTSRLEALAALVEMPWEICHLAPKLKDDPEIIMLAINHWNSNLCDGPLAFAGDSIKRNSEIVLAAVK